MAILAEPRWRAFDAEGDAHVGAKLHIYQSGGLVHADLFGEADLDPGSALPNPLTSDANGVFPQFFLAISSYDAVAKDLLGNTLYESTSLPGVGTEDGAIVRIFDNTELIITEDDIGDGSTVGVVIKAGTDGGTYANIGFMSKTGLPLDNFRVNADLTTIDGDAAVTGELDVAAKGLKEDGRRITRTLSFEPLPVVGAGEAALSLINDPIGTRRWKITFYDVYFSSAVAIPEVRLSYDNGATYKSGASDYSFSYDTLGAAPTTDDAHTEIRIFGSSNSDANNPWTIEVEVLTPDSGAGATHIWGRIIGNTNSGTSAPGIILFEGCGEGGYGRATNLKLFPSTGAITCNFTCEQVRGFGE